MTVEITDLRANKTLDTLPERSNGPLEIVVTEPRREELRQLGEKLAIPFEELEDALDEDERPRIEEIEGYLKIIFRVPITFEDGEVTEATTTPVFVFLSKDVIIRVLLRKMSFKKLRQSKMNEVQRTPLVAFFEFLQQIIRSFEHRLDILDQKIHDAELNILKTIKPKSIWQVFRLSKDSIYLEASLKGNIRVFNRLKYVKTQQLFTNSLDQLEDLTIDLDQQVELIMIYRELLENSLDAYASVISNNQNDLIKILTSISLILMVPTLIASFYGMNIALPFASSQYAFWIILAISTFFTVLLYVFFKVIDWV